MWLSFMMMSLLPVVVMTMSSVSSCDSSVLTWKPSMAAWSAQMGSHSVTVVTQPAAFMAKAQPFPTSP